MTHTNNNNVFDKLGKKVVAGGMAVILSAVGIASAIFAEPKAEKQQKTTIETTDEDPMNKLLVLTKEFDINDHDVVMARAKAICNIAGKKYKDKQTDIANLIYVLAGNKESIVYPKSAKTDAQKFEYIRSLLKTFNKVLSTDLQFYIDAMAIGAPTAEELSSVPSGYMFMPGKSDSLEKVKGIELSKIYYAQLNNIKNNDKKAMKTTAEEFYKFAKSIVKMEINDNDKYILLNQVINIKPIFTKSLSLEKAEEIDNLVGLISTYQNAILQKATEGLNITEILEAGNYGNEIKLDEEYVASDEKDAAKQPVVQKDNANATTSIAEEGGNPEKNNQGKQEIINTPTTSTSTTSWQESVTNGSVVVTDPSGEEFVVEITGEGTYEYTIPGGEAIGEMEPVERYLDADKANAEELGNTYTLG